MGVGNLTIHENSEYQKYLNCGGHLRPQQYRDYLHAVQDKIVGLISNDPGDHLSDICRRILKSSDTKTRLAFAQTCQGLYQRCQRDFFVDDYKGIITRYIQQNTSYSNYVKENAGSLFVSSLLKLVGIGAVAFLFNKASYHRAQIPPDAPKIKKIILCSEHEYVYTDFEVEYIDHFEAKLANEFTDRGLALGIIVGLGICAHYATAIGQIDHFLEISEKDLLSEITNIHQFTKIFFPGYYRWKIEKMKVNLASNPTHWKKDPRLSQLICPISKDFMLFPVKDKCNHYFDYRSIRASQLDPNNVFPLKCPISGERFAFSKLRFDMTLFYKIHLMISDPNHQPVPDIDTTSSFTQLKEDNLNVIGEATAAGELRIPILESEPSPIMSLPTQQTDDDPNVVGETSTAGALRMTASVLESDS